MIDRHLDHHATPSAHALTREGWARPQWQQMKRGRGNVHEQYYGERTLLHRAALGEKVTCARVLLAHGADVNATDEDGWTPLHWAASRGHASCVHVLLHFKANVRATDINERTALDWATKYNHQTVCKLLREAMTR